MPHRSRRRALVLRALPLLAVAVALTACSPQQGTQVVQDFPPTATPTPPGARVTPTPTSPPTAAATPQPTPTPRRQTLKGVSLSPKSFAPADFTAFFQLAVQAGGVVTWAGDWTELAKPGAAPAVVAELAKTYGHTPVVIAQVFTQSTGALLRPLDDATVAAYVRDAAAFTERHRPRYMGFGIEVNMLHEKSPEDFERFVTLFQSTRDAVKKASPDTRVFVVFQLERMKGLQGGLFGGVHDPGKAQWALLDRFPGADLIAFTTYPGLVHKDPSDIPGDYYAEAARRTARPVAFTEIGWHAAPGPAGWESGNEEQARFVERYFALTDGLAPELAVWAFLYDQRTVEPFATMGLHSADGIMRPAWQEWTRPR